MASDRLLVRSSAPPPGSRNSRSTGILTVLNRSDIPAAGFEPVPLGKQGSQQLAFHQCQPLHFYSGSARSSWACQCRSPPRPPHTHRSHQPQPRLQHCDHHPPQQPSAASTPTLVAPEAAMEVAGRPDPATAVLSTCTQISPLRPHQRKHQQNNTSTSNTPPTEATSMQEVAPTPSFTAAKTSPGLATLAGTVACSSAHANVISICRTATASGRRHRHRPALLIACLAVAPPASLSVTSTPFSHPPPLAALIPHPFS